MCKYFVIHCDAGWFFFTKVSLFKGKFPGGPSATSA